jgi:hypothetical protein
MNCNSTWVISKQGILSNKLDPSAVACALQFESKRVSADELEQYLHTAELAAKEAEARALAHADAGG